MIACIPVAPGGADMHLRSLRRPAAFPGDEQMDDAPTRSEARPLEREGEEEEAWTTIVHKK